MGFRKDGQLDLRKLPKIVVRPLSRHGADGLSAHYFDHEFDSSPKYTEPTIELDVGLKGKKKLEILIHEAMHLAFPWMAEIIVRKGARYLAMILWSQKLRFLDEIED